MAIFASYLVLALIAGFFWILLAPRFTEIYLKFMSKFKQREIDDDDLD